MRPRKFQRVSLVSIVLPTYNEAGNIIDLIREIDDALKRPKEIIVVDDNSPDGTSLLVRRYKKEVKKPYVRLETRYTNRGLTNSIRHGINCSKGNVVAWMDCDFSMPPTLIPRLVAEIEKGYDVAIGSRYVEGGFPRPSKKGAGESTLSTWASIVLNKLVQLLLGNWIHDYTSGFVAARRSVLSKIPLRGDYGEYCIDFLYRTHAHGLSIAEVPYVCLPRRHGESKTAQTFSQLLWRSKNYLKVTLSLFKDKHNLHKVP